MDSKSPVSATTTVPVALSWSRELVAVDSVFCFFWAGSDILS